MAEDDSSQEKTEEPTPKRLEKAREDGQVPRSRELTTSAILIAGSVGLFVLMPFMSQRLLDISRYNFSLDRRVVFDPALMVQQLAHSFADALWSLVPLFSILLVAAILGPIALGGWLWSVKAMAPKASRMNPMEGLKRMFGVKGLIELVKAVAKVLLILSLAILLLVSMQQDMLELANQAVNPAIVDSFKLAGWAAIALSAITLFIVILDVPFQMWDHSRKLKMSRQDIKDEMKDSEGKPEVKGRIRQLQREMANNRQLAAVPEADVVITNPTHFSVAVKYDPDTMQTPIVLAKGVDFFALKIREVAKANDVQIMESPVLARAIYHTTDVDQEIPAGLYMAVAQILAYVFQLRNYRKGKGERPPFPRNIDVPEEMRFDP
ncbi:flagellar type III secretion system protein FlhB [Pseudomaricurvus alkylphenolicus]|jgi:flagellar biosynthetic protein FlhB|uniref:flagellar biosynthesis protein FlhB n=1 Tax=Pseudomaricurvus alkylphenolicus TaxID=1306991 RepID=UPI001423D086|nr:flagellar biosynthesis protein FlhB [Pseudomaricurvus alkylphenolicus]NIB43193.1 flagellar type III secretion system protein FlhB [Pseudomaricurvus alkylphenolicus]